ncbi:MAG TPA: hypothetical protein VNU46_07315, partial [Gemmatimonadaceae bacterium]|nr:hypothetical protein [Gemmatimonadaceae bacterium]
LYRTDAYHSLSIEGYRVTEALIQRVATGLWNPGEHGSDADARNASGTGHDARVLRLTGTRATGIGEGGPGALHVCLHSSVHGRQWSHGDIAPFASFVASCMRDY